MKACVPVRKENIEATPDPSEFSYLLRDEQRVAWGSLLTVLKYQIYLSTKRGKGSK